MKSLLRISICGSAIALFSISPGFAQIKGDPKMQGKVEQLTVPKSPSKLNGALNTLHNRFELNRLNKTKPAASLDGLQNFLQLKGDKVLADFTVKKNVSAAKAELEKIGVEITGIYGRVISGFIPIGSLPQLETASSIRFAKPSYKPWHQSVTGNNTTRYNLNFVPPGSPVISQGDTAMRSFLAKKKYHVNGNGVKVGIISDSYNNLGTAHIGVKRGELPGKGNPFGYKRPVQVLADIDSGGTDEGRAMMEIVHDVAPGAKLAFYTASNGEAAMAQGIQILADKGCTVISDDVLYFDEPFFQDGIIAQSVDIAKKKGVSYFSAAGNNSIRSYENDYHPTDVEPFGPGFGTAHNFSGPGDQPRYFQPLYVPNGGVLIMSFQWDQSSYAASGVGPDSDLDIFLTDINGNIVAAAFNSNIEAGEPIELMGYFNDTKNYTFFLTIVKYDGPNPGHIKYNLYGDALFYLTDPPIPGILAPTLVGHAKAAGAIATGAAWYLNTPAYGSDTPRVEGFSAKGGVANYFDINGNRIAPLIRNKPNIVAPDGGNTSFFDPFGGGDISEDTDTYPNFFGTSAAAPHAAGVAALMIEAQKLNSITPDQIKGVLSATAVDMDDIFTDGFDKGFDFNTGYGFVNAEKAVGKVKFPNLYIKNLNLKPLCADQPSSVRRWEIDNPNPFPVDVSWFLEGSQQQARLSAEPGKTVFTTTTLSSPGCLIPNIALLTWKDNFGFPRFDLAFGTTARCGKDEISPANSDKEIAARAGTTGHTSINANNVAEVYPNPSVNTFSLYLSLATQQLTNIELFSIDGKKLLSKTVYQSKGVIDIDANNYKPGVYLLNIRQGNFTKTIKLIKQ